MGARTAVFQHNARSRRCPIKCWAGAMVPMPLNTKKQKDNQEAQNNPSRLSEPKDLSPD
jgi:hypothetical protein